MSKTIAASTIAAMFFHPHIRWIALLTLALFSVQSFSPVSQGTINPLLADKSYCGTQTDNPGANVIVISSPIANKTPAPVKHPGGHCPLCYIHATQFIIGYSHPLTVRSANFFVVRSFSSTPNDSLQQQQLDLLAPTHAPPRIA